MTPFDPRPAGARRPRRGALLLAGGAALAACGRDPGPPAWHSLADGFVPRPLAELVADWERADAPTGNRVQAGVLGIELHHAYAPSDWRPAEPPGCWEVELPRGAFARSGARPRLVARGAEFPRAEIPSAEAETGAPVLGRIRVEARSLTLFLAPGTSAPPPTLLVLERPGGPAIEKPVSPAEWFALDEPAGAFRLDAPRRVTLTDARLYAALVAVDEPRALQPDEYRFEPQRLLLCSPSAPPPPGELVAHLEQGRVVDDQWQLRLGRFCAYGIPVWSGGRQELTLDVPPGSRLDFRFVHAPGAAQTARVRLDGQPLVELTPEAGDEPRPVNVLLPPAGRSAARLEFEVEGPAGLGAFLTPMLVPTDDGALRARAGSIRPDVLLVIVDTLRADSLATWGGSPELAPRLERQARAGLRFLDARSNAAWTLPSISSILTGIHPGQHGATDEDLVLVAANETLAERFLRAGYRTGAITDGSFFLPTFGLDQGFEWFAHHEPEDWSLDHTLAEARAFLEQDDGRPLFLALHTYRVHQPYRVGPDEDSGAYEALMTRAREEAGTRLPRGMVPLAGHAAELRDLYHAGVRDLDEKLGAFLEGLEARGWFEHGVLAFTSDHGESLGENGVFFHGGHLWETRLEVPLFLRGTGILPGENGHSAGPIDLAPTLAELTGLEPDPRWVGHSLLHLEEERPAFAFQLTTRSRQAACIEDGHKVILTPDEARLASGECEEAYDLARDPGESANLAGSADWPVSLTLRLAPLLATYLVPRVPVESASVTEEMRAKLDALGYGGENP